MSSDKGPLGTSAWLLRLPVEIFDCIVVHLSRLDYLVALCRASKKLSRPEPEGCNLRARVEAARDAPLEDAMELGVNHLARTLVLEDEERPSYTLLASLLTKSARLEVLCLCGEEAADNGTVALAEALKVNRVLTELNLGDNEIGDVGAAALGEAVKFNAALTILVLGYNQIGDVGATVVRVDD